MDLVIFGSGGFAREVAAYAVDAGFTLRGFLDLSRTAWEEHGAPAPAWLGRPEDYQPAPGEVFALGMAEIAVRAEMIARWFDDAGWPAATIIHPTATVMPGAEIGSGSVLGPRVHIGVNARPGPFTVMNYGCSFGHDGVSGRNNVFSSGVQLAGYVTLGANNFFGIAASVQPRLTLGDGNRIQAGVSVAANVSSGAFVFRKDQPKTAFLFAPQPAAPQSATPTPSPTPSIEVTTP
ncbi:acetyltransferase [Tistrella mobilis]